MIMHQAGIATANWQQQLGIGTYVCTDGSYMGISYLLFTSYHALTSFFFGSMLTSPC